MDPLIRVPTMRGGPGPHIPSDPGEIEISIIGIGIPSRVIKEHDTDCLEYIRESPIIIPGNLRLVHRPNIGPHILPIPLSMGGDGGCGRIGVYGIRGRKGGRGIDHGDDILIVRLVPNQGGFTGSLFVHRLPGNKVPGLPGNLHKITMVIPPQFPIRIRTNGGRGVCQPHQSGFVILNTLI